MFSLGGLSMMLIQVRQQCFKLLQSVIFAIIIIMVNQAFAATGTVTISGPNSITIPLNSSFLVSGTYVLSSDPPASGNAICWDGSAPTYVSYIRGGKAPRLTYNIHGWARYTIDNIGTGYTVADLIAYDGGSTIIGKTTGFQFRVSTNNMALGSTHTVKVYLEDYGMGLCPVYPFFMDIQRGPVFASASIRFTIGYPKPPTINIALAKPAITPCDAESGTITVTSNDPTPNGGTVTLTFPDGSSTSAPFAGKTATLTFADFGLPSGYLDGGAHPPGASLTFTANVTTAAGNTATSTATANVVAGGLSVTVKPAKNILLPWIHNSREASFAGRYSTPVDIQVSQNGIPIIGANVSTIVKMVPGTETYGMHDHGAVDGANKPTGTMMPAAGTTTIGGMFTTQYHTSQFAGQDTIEATASYQGCTGKGISAAITAQVPQLAPIQIPAGSNHQFVGGTCEHYGGYTPWKPGKTTACGGATGSSNQYISTAVQGSFYKLLNEFSRLYPGIGMYINDASLEFGGMFDVNGGWCTSCSKGHSTHRLGYDVDFALKDTSAPSGPPVANRNLEPKLDRLRKKNNALFKNMSIQLHPTPADPDHLHIWFIR